MVEFEAVVRVEKADEEDEMCVNERWGGIDVADPEASSEAEVVAGIEVSVEETVASGVAETGSAVEVAVTEDKAAVVSTSASADVVAASL